MKILCFGDSNTYRYDPRSYFGGQYNARHRWVDLLAERIGCTAVNAGENGRKIPVRPGDLQRFDLMLANQRPLDLFLIMLGTNDLLQGSSPEVITKRMEYFLTRIGLESNKIILLGMPPMQLGEWVEDPALIRASLELNRLYHALALRLEISFADAGKWDIALAYDGVHFTEEGHQIFAEKLYHYLTKEIKLCWKKERKHRNLHC